MTIQDKMYWEEKKEQAKGFIFSHKKEIALTGTSMIAGVILGRKIERKAVIKDYSKQFGKIVDVVYQRACALTAERFGAYLKEHVPKANEMIVEYFNTHPEQIEKMDFSATAYDLLHDIPGISFKGDK